jgi:hypothetical protein
MLLGMKNLRFVCTLARTKRGSSAKEEMGERV